MKCRVLTTGIMALAIAVGLGAAASAQIAPGTATIDGNLSDWAGATWNPITVKYDGDPSDITSASYATRWAPDKIYVAIKVEDTSHQFTDSYSGWNARDAIEFYVHTTGSGSTAYSSTQADAQQWVTGINTSGSGTWTSLGSSNYVVPASDFETNGSVDGNWLYYEAAITPFESYGSYTGGTNVISTLSAGQTIGFDLTVVSIKDGAYAGMLALSSAAPKWNDYSTFQQQTLVPEPSAILGLLTGFGGLATFIRRKRA